MGSHLTSTCIRMRWGAILLLLCVALVLVDAKKKPKGKGKSKPTKGECFTKGPKPKSTSKQDKKKFFEKYTLSSKGCPCWWDITQKEGCACCKPGKDIQQCGYPMQEYCYKKNKKKPMGCPGVCNNEFTYSTKGFPCYSDHSNKNCAWFTEKGFQCDKKNKDTGVDAKEGSRCTNGKNKNYCKNQQGDCKHTPGCDVNAECKFKKKLSRYLSYWQCECQKPWKGNGIQCQDANGAFSSPPNLGAEMTLSLTKEEYTYPFNNGELSLGEKMEALNQEMNGVAGNVCDGDSCNATFNQTVQEN